MVCSEHVLEMKIPRCKLSSLDNGFIPAFYNKHHPFLAHHVLDIQFGLFIFYDNGKFVGTCFIFIQDNSVLPSVSARAAGAGVLAGGAHPGPGEAGGQQRGEVSTALQRAPRPGQTQQQQQQCIITNSMNGPPPLLISIESRVQVLFKV